MRYIAVLFAVAVALAPLGLRAEDPASPSSISEHTALEQSMEPERAPSLPAIIVETWAQTLEAIESGDLKAVNKLVADLEQLKLQADVSALDSYAMVMIRQGQSALREGNREKAAFYARKTLQLSPRSPVILALSLPLVRQTKTASTAGQVVKILQQLWRHPNVALRVVKHCIYPLLLACTIGVLVAMALTFALKAETLHRGLSRSMPTGIRGLVSPVILLILLAGPLYFGPLWSLLVWALVLYVYVPQYRWLGFTAGTLLALWGTLLPIRESLRNWLEHPGVQAMLDVSSGVFSASDKARLEALSLERNNDGPLFFALGQVLRRHGEYQKSDEAFLRAEMLLGAQPWTAAQRGVTAYLDGKFDKSDQFFKQAQDLGLSSAEFFFNYSKTKFEIMDTAAARQMLTRAIQKDKELTRALEEREHLLGSQARLAVAEIQLPFYRVISSALHPTASIRKQYEGVASALMQGMAPPHILTAGCLVILSFFFARRRKSRTVPLSSYPNLLPVRFLRRLLMLIPGGAWVRAEQPLWCFAIVSACLLMVMPLLEWPAESGILVQAFPELVPLYIGFVSLFGLCACYVGGHLEVKG